MQYPISIPKPCHEDWAAMTPDGQGRHCAQCCKTVIDFTDQSPEEIAAYLQAQRQPVCGRFRADQVADNSVTPETYIHRLQRSGLSFLKRVAALILFVFCLSAADADAQRQPQQHLTGEPVAVPQEPRLLGKVAPPKQRPATQPARQPDDRIMGAVPMPRQDTQKHIKGRVIRKK